MKYYLSPRWTNELPDCSMPMTFDTYNKCSFNCLYCFSYFQKSHTLGNGGQKVGQHDYQQDTDISYVNISKIKELFNLSDGCSKKYKQFFDYIKDRKVMQWGGLADQFDYYEKQYGITLELMKFFKEINYPLSFCTKSDWWVYDDRYTDIIKNQKNWHFKISIININEKRSKLIECGTPSPQERLKVINRLKNIGVEHITLRLRPFIIGMSDRNDEYLELIKQAKDNGADSVSTEFFCLERRADKRLLDRYSRMSEAIGFDILKFYIKNTPNSAGYLRLNRNVKKPYIEKMKNLCDKLGMRFYVSDAHLKEKCSNGSCCGLPESWNYSRGQFTEALMIAKKNGKVYFSDISKNASFLKDIKWCDACGLNYGNIKNIVKHNNLMLYDFLRNLWNNPNNRNSPYKYFGGVLIPMSVDEDKNVVYKYNEK